MKLSVVILCWNDLKVIPECLRSIYATTLSTEFEVIVSDNGSTDASIEFIREAYPQVQILENRRNLRFAKANNVGIQASRGEYVLILNPDTIIHEGTLDSIVEYADAHPSTGAFGCRVVNADGSYQVSARPFASPRNEWITALYLRWLGHLGPWFLGDSYPGWKGETERHIEWITGCFMLIRRDLLNRLRGFDPQFFYYYEDMDLCRRIWQSGSSILFTPHVSITHLKGQSTNQRLPPLAFALDSQITRYRYYYKHYGKYGAKRARRIALASLCVRRIGHAAIDLMKPTESRRRRLELLRNLFYWNYRVDPIRLVENGEEPELSVQPMGRVLER